MKEYTRKRLKKSKGITLIALVITIIVLLILAGVSLSMVFSQQGIFNRAENAVDKHSQSKARETLDLVFSEAQMKKYDEGLSDDELNKMIETVGQLLPKEDPESKYQLVIVDGYIFEIDRSVPKVVDYKGPADGIIITATISGNNGWVKPGEPVTVKGSIKIYGEGSIASSSAEVTKGSTTITGFPTKGGDYTISNITEDTDIKITATDSKGKSYEKIVQVVIKRDTTPPTITEVKAEAEGSKIKISAIGHDKNASGIEESGIKQFEYKITSAEDTTLAGIPADKREGTFLPGEILEIQSTKYVIYTITVKAVDNCNNTSEPQIVDVETGLTIAEAKQKVNSTTLKDYIGVRITDYTTDDSGIKWRVFYQDNERQSNGKGYFGDDLGTLYLKRDYDKDLRKALLSDYSATEIGINIMKQMNPLWRESEHSKAIDLRKEKAVSWLCEPTVWEEYKIEGIAKYAIGGTSAEMWKKAYNLYVEKNQPNNARLNCILSEIANELGGYKWKAEGGNSSLALDTNITKSNVFVSGEYQWLVSPYGGGEDYVCSAGLYSGAGYNLCYQGYQVCPMVCLN